jgi:hypothetical protein
MTTPIKIVDDLNREILVTHAIDAAIVGLTHPNAEVTDASYEGLRVLLDRHIGELLRISIALQWGDEMAAAMTRRAAR